MTGAPALPKHGPAAGVSAAPVHRAELSGFLINHGVTEDTEMDRSFFTTDGYESNMDSANQNNEAERGRERSTNELNLGAGMRTQEHRSASNRPAQLKDERPHFYGSKKAR